MSKLRFVTVQLPQMRPGDFVKMVYYAHGESMWDIAGFPVWRNMSVPVGAVGLYMRKGKDGGRLYYVVTVSDSGELVTVPGKNGKSCTSLGDAVDVLCELLAKMPPEQYLEYMVYCVSEQIKSVARQQNADGNGQRRSQGSASSGRGSRYSNNLGGSGRSGYRSVRESQYSNRDDDDSDDVPF